MTAADLTPREIEVLTLVARGKSDWSIGIILGVSENTAKFHVANIRRKLNAGNRIEAAVRAALAGVINP